MYTRLQTLTLLFLPALIMGGALTGIFSIGGLGYDWAFIGGATLVTLACSAFTVLADWWSLRPIKARR